MPLRMFSEVFWPKRGSLASRPSCAAASSSGRESMPSTSWIWRILATPSPEMASISTRPGGICSRSSSSMLARPVATSSVTIWSVAGPTPLVAASEPSSMRLTQVAGKLATARAAVRKARMRNGFSPAQLEEGGDLLEHVGHGLAVGELLQGVHCTAPAAGPPAELEQLLPADQGVESRRRATRQRRGEERRAILPGERARPRPRDLHHAEPHPVRMQTEDAEDPELVRAGPAETKNAVERLGRLAFEDLGPDAGARETERSRRTGASPCSALQDAGAEQVGQLFRQRCRSSPGPASQKR